MTSSSLSSSLPLSAGVLVDHRAEVNGAFDRFSPTIYRYVLFRVGGDGHLADDLMQQLWIAASTGQRTPDGDGWEAWLRGIARNLVRQHWRQHRRQVGRIPIVEPELAAHVADRLTHEDMTAAAMENKQLRDQLMLALTALPCQDQTVLIGRYFHGRSLAELAEELGSTERAIEGRLYRARKTLQQTLKDLDPMG